MSSWRRRSAELLGNLKPFARARVDSNRQGPGEGNNIDWRERARSAAAVVAVLLVVGNGLVGAMADPGDGTWGGEIHLEGDPAGDGTEWSYPIQDASSVTEPNVTLTGSTTYENETASGELGNGESLPVEIAGTHDPLGPSGSTPKVTFKGTEVSESETWNATNVDDGESVHITVDGNSEPENSSVTFEGREKTTQESASATNLADGDSLSYQVDGNLDPRGPASGEPEVVFEGEGFKRSDSQSGSLNPGGQDPLGVDGNLGPTGPSTNNKPVLEVTGRTETSSGPYSSYGANDVAAGDIDSSNTHSEVIVDNTPNKVRELTFPITEYDGDNDGSISVTVDIYINTNGIDQSYGDGTLVKSGYAFPDSGGEITVALDNPIDLSGSSQATVELVTTSASGSDFVRYDVDDSVGSVFYSASDDGTAQQAADMTASSGDPTNVDVSSDDGTSHTFGDFADGETKSTEFAMSDEASSLSLSADGGAFDYQLDWTERAASQDPALDIDGDGTNEVAHSGTLFNGETAAYQASSLEVGDDTATVSTTGESTVSVTIDYTEVTGSENTSIDIDGDGQSDASYTGVLAEGEKVSKEIAELKRDTQSVVTSIDSGTVDWSISANERTVTEEPSIDINGDGTHDMSVTGKLSPGQTVTRETDKITLNTSEIEVSTTNKSVVNISASYRERTKSKNAEVRLNGYAMEVDGVLKDGETVTLNGSENYISEGENTVRVSVSEEVSADAPAPAVEVDYRHRASVTHEARRSAHGLQDDYDINHTFVGERENASLDLSVSEHTTGFETLRLKRGSGAWTSLDDSDYHLSDGKLSVDLGSVSPNETVELNATAWKVRVNDGAIDVVERTPPGNSLDSRIEVTEKGEDFYIRTQNDRVHYTYNESWDARDRVRVLAGSEQRLKLPNADEGATTSLTKSPLEVIPKTGDVVVEFEQVHGDNPQFRVDSGRIGGDTIVYSWHDTISSHRYSLWSMTYQTDRGSEVVGSEAATWTDDDNPESLQVVHKKVGGPGTNLNGVSIWETLLELLRGGGFVVIGLGGIIGLFFAGDYYEDRLAEEDSPTADYTSWGLSGLGTVVLIPIMIELLNPGAISDRIGIAVSNAIASAIETVAGPIGIIGVVGLIVLGWSATQAWRASNDTDVVIEGGEK